MSKSKLVAAALGGLPQPGVAKLKKDGTTSVLVRGRVVAVVMASGRTKPVRRPADAKLAALLTEKTTAAYAGAVVLTDENVEQVRALLADTVRNAAVPSVEEAAATMKERAAVEQAPRLKAAAAAKRAAAAQRAPSKKERTAAPRTRAKAARSGR